MKNPQNINKHDTGKLNEGKQNWSRKNLCTTQGKIYIFSFLKIIKKIQTRVPDSLSPLLLHKFNSLLYFINNLGYFITIIMQKDEVHIELQKDMKKLKHTFSSQTIIIQDLRISNGGNKSYTLPTNTTLLRVGQCHVVHLSGPTLTSLVNIHTLHLFDIDRLHMSYDFFLQYGSQLM